MSQGMGLGNNQKPEKDTRNEEVERNPYEHYDRQEEPEPEKSSGMGMKIFKGIVVLSALVIVGIVGMSFFGGDSADDAVEGVVPEGERVVDMIEVPDDIEEDEDVYVASLLAEEHVMYNPFSKEGLIVQLQEDGVEETLATETVEGMEVDWNDKALEASERYVEYATPEVSEEGLREQLEYEYFTADEIDYAVSNIDLEALVAEFEAMYEEMEAMEEEMRQAEEEAEAESEDAE